MNEFTTTQRVSNRQLVDKLTSTSREVELVTAMGPDTSKGYVGPPRAEPGVTIEAEDPITSEQDTMALSIRSMSNRLEKMHEDILYASERLSQPSMLRDSACVRFFALYSLLRGVIKQIDEAIGSEIDTTSMSDGRKHDIGRLQGMVQRYLERIGENKANAEGKLVMLKRRLWARATNIPELKKHAITKEYVKETVSVQTLSSWVRELEEDEQGMPKLPDAIKDAIEVTEKFGVSARNG